MSLQPLFRRFHETIQLAQYDENAELREKRDRVLKRLRDNLEQSFESFNQGSYAMGTGIKPLDGDYDIDIGIVFNDVYHDEHDPVTVKGWVYKAVKEHTARVEWRRPCITVFYQQGGEPKYHVDLAVFAQERNSDRLHLAIGKEHSAKDQREWQRDDRKGFIGDVKNRFSGEDGAQFRRVIRYLKRWKDEHFPSTGYAAPSGLCLTVAAYHWFQPTRTSGWNGDHDDLAATHSLVRAILGEFQCYPFGSHCVHRLHLQFPRAPHDDVCERMTDQQMTEFQQRLVQLEDWLGKARQTSQPAWLRKAFGRDFPLE